TSKPRAHPGDNFIVGMHPARVRVCDPLGDGAEQALAIGFGGAIVRGRLAGLGGGSGHGGSLPRGEVTAACGPSEVIALEWSHLRDGLAQVAIHSVERRHAART